MKYLFPFFVALIYLTFAFASSTDPLPNLQQPRYNLFTSGQPTPEGFRIIAQTGVMTVVNVLPTRECLVNEEGMVRANKMIYHHFPFETTGFKRETFEQFAQTLTKAKKPILIHCLTGNHVGGLWFGYRVLIDKASLAVALKEARMIGMKPELEDAMFNWLASRFTSRQQSGK